MNMSEYVLQSRWTSAYKCPVSSSEWTVLSFPLPRRGTAPLQLGGVNSDSCGPPESSKPLLMSLQYSPQLFIISALSDQVSRENHCHGLFIWSNKTSKVLASGMEKLWSQSWESSPAWLSDTFFIRNKINILIRISEETNTHMRAHTHTYTKASKQSRRQREIDYLAEQVSSLGQDSRLLFHYLFFFLFVSFWVTLSQSSSELRVFSNLLYVHFNKGQPKPVHQFDILNQTSFANRIIH